MTTTRLIRLALLVSGLLAAAFTTEAAAQGAPARLSSVGLDFEIRGSVLQPDTSTAFSMSAPQDDDSYDEYWSIGTGGGADISMPLFLLADPKKAMHLTLAPFIGFDHYELIGDTKEYDGGGKLEPDNWTATTFFGGLQARLIWGYDTSPIRFLIGVDVAGGMVAYGGVSGDFIASPGATPVVGHIFDSSTTSALRGVARTGLMLRLSHTAHLTIHASAGMLMLGAPDGNTDPANPFGDSDPGAWTPLIGGVGVSLRLRF
ncbi:MAG: hypothetical protein ACYTGX_07615 [Planctomycetota bacterium]|jgi:hypothetical protein